eukprot:CAMPEP_0182419398 /NCGR_PEP_ID=MMETSP1167-20130531/3866_1 /TAXON_ID=2988 /ORGANISM="Mallomonas Sp, Strain CCMP3275" /LENGTH=557 /DNA_ID=CAMNT_0024594309 /DNA_START=39 /DNA_END=1712 /DNA_ORIENTATION=-
MIFFIAFGFVQLSLAAACGSAGQHLSHTGGAREVKESIEEHLHHIRERFHTPIPSSSSCLDFFLGDNFGAGWNDAKLYVYDNDGNFDSYAPNKTSNQVNIKYCYDFKEKVLTKSVVGSHIEKKTYPSKDLFLYATMQYFHIMSPYSIRWTTKNEKTDEIYTGNHLTKMVFQFTDSSINFVSALDLPSNKVNPPTCKSCLHGKTLPSDSSDVNNDNGKLTLRIRRPNLNEYTGNVDTDLIKEMALYGHQDTWFRDDGFGTTYEITDLLGSTVFFAGQLCSGDKGGSACAVNLPAGDYVWRVNGALDPYRDEIAWTFCDTQGGARTELVFEIDSDGHCLPGVRRYSYEVATEEEESDIKVIDPSNSHRVLLQGSFDLHGLNSDDLNEHEKAMLEYFITAQFNEVKSVEDGTDEPARVTSWQQVVPDMFYRRGRSDAAIVDRVTFNIHINLDSYRLGGQADSTTKELVANFKRYIGLVMESGAFLSRMHKIRESKLHHVTQVKLVELVKISETGGPIDEESFMAEDYMILLAIGGGLLVGLGVYLLRCRSTKDKKVKLKM